MLDTLPSDVVTLDPRIDLQLATPVAEPRRWSLGTRIAFRFTTLYFGLYNLGATGLMKGLATWSATSLFKVSYPFVTVATGSGDKTIDWLESFWLLVFATVATAAWSTIDRKRPNYEAVNKWFRVFLRFAVGSTMVGYGMVKAIPLQMPAPSLQRLVEPFGNFSPMGVLWYSIGASFPYERFAGSMELLGATLLFIPRLSLLGAMVTFATAVQIFTLNMTYDVPVKLFSIHRARRAAASAGPSAEQDGRTVYRAAPFPPSYAAPRRRDHPARPRRLPSRRELLRRATKLDTVWWRRAEVSSLRHLERQRDEGGWCRTGRPYRRLRPMAPAAVLIADEYVVPAHGRQLPGLRLHGRHDGEDTRPHGR